jgi:sugar transferase (PEP-CTERM/EpsH1 system associated)
MTKEDTPAGERGAGSALEVAAAAAGASSLVIGGSLVGHSSFARPLPTILYLTHRVPFPPDKGDRIRNYHLLRQLARRGRVWLGCLADEPVTAEVRAELDRLCERVAVVPVSGKQRWLRAGRSVLTGGSISEGAFAEPGLFDVVRSWVREAGFGAAVISASSLAPYLKDRSLDGVPRFVDLVDVDSQKWLDFAAAARGPKRWLYRFEAARVRKLERGLPAWTEAVAMVSRAEADVFDSFTQAGAATVAANGVDLDYFRPRDVPVEPALAFVGAMDYLPNVDGAVWFAREVWPAVRARHPAAEFRVVGRKPAPEVQRLADLPGVRVLGSVPDVRPFVSSAAAAVVPLRLARGIQNKVLEAMALGRPVVAAPPALAALGTVPGRHLLRAATPDEWVEACCGLLADHGRGNELGAAGRRYVETHHHWESCLEPFLNKVVPTDVAHR